MDNKTSTQTLATEIEKSVRDYLRYLRKDWYTFKLGCSFGWGQSAHICGIETASLFGLNYIGHGCSRVVFRYKDSPFVIKIEKESQFVRNHDHDLANDAEWLIAKIIAKHAKWCLPFIVRPLKTFHVGKHRILVVPFVEHENEHNDDYDDYDDETDSWKDFNQKCINLFKDQCVACNTFKINGTFVSIDYTLTYVFRSPIWHINSFTSWASRMVKLPEYKEHAKFMNNQHRQLKAKLKETV